MAIVQNRSSLELERALELDELRTRNALLESQIGSCEKLRDPLWMWVRPFWTIRASPIDPNLCFLLMPFKKPWSDSVWNTVVRAAEDKGLTCLRASQGIGSRIMEDIWAGICRARTVIADLTDNNPNVTYEVGLADAVGRDVILLSQTTAPDAVPFNFLGRRLVEYRADEAGLAQLRRDICHRL